MGDMLLLFKYWNYRWFDSHEMLPLFGGQGTNGIQVGYVHYSLYIYDGIYLHLWSTECLIL